MEKIEEKLKEFVLENKYENSLDEWKEGFNGILSQFKNEGLIYHFYVKCDEENNIYLDKDIKVADVYLEPIKGEGIFVNQITIAK